MQSHSVYGFLQWIDRTHYFAKLAKRGSKTFLRCARKIEERSVEMARRRNCHAVCCGHTHAAAAHIEQPVAYYNSGCWTELPCTYLTVRDGEVRLHDFQPVPPIPTEENAASSLPTEQTVFG